MRHVAIVTGASSGFGLLTTLELAKRGFHVLATMRDIQKAIIFKEHVKELSLLDRIEVYPLDVTKQEDIEAFQKKVEEFDHVRVLVNNAGIAIGGFSEQIEMEDYRRQFETNVFGVMATTQAILPKMREQGEGTIINVSSISGLVGFPGLSPYVASKYALEGYSESLRLEMMPFGVQVALVEPGSFSTNIWSSGMEIAGGVNNDQSPYATYMEKLMATMESGKNKHGDPQLVAKLICEIAMMKEVKKLRYPIGRGVRAQLMLKRLLPWHRWERIIINTILQEK
ncbi:SDR family oxidoreductase [Aquibacillus koreensis]|uniref:SDR family oxidoreductase n=1 Tax=Aquibacillus koreensis TaxID=279446 RepID=A0A9X3WMJ6_9BACI|nr:SDR family oxidoreductase [Aquibacillus koreensis]MCT2535684.1 SDR family oxidoreductase [Aquibacillus koreensis]MDC3420031.1 SDR family oxidoreductase [Aquibacillus koreensis]